MKTISPSSTTLALGFLLMTLVGQCYGQLYVGYYNRRCGKYNVEGIIFNVVKAAFARDPKTVSHLIRLQFHDCIVRGCDASVLLDGKNTEKTAPPNLTLGGYDVVDAAKLAVEKVCPGVVSCTDVLIIAARASVLLAGGKWYDVETGRRDGFVSSQSEALANLPPANISAQQGAHLFASRGLTKEDFVVLLGGHTVGTAHCNNFKNRLYNYHNTRKADPRMNHDLLTSLQGTCPQYSHANYETFLDHTPTSHYQIDNAYYKQIIANKGILEVDSNLATSPLTNGIVRKLAFTPNYFYDKFGPAMVKMGRIGVLTGKQGQIRKSCRVVNH